MIPRAVTVAPILALCLAFAGCSLPPSADRRPTTGGEGVLGYIIRDPGGIRLQRGNGTVRVSGPSGSVGSSGSASADGAYVSVYDIPVTDLQDMLNSHSETGNISHGAARIAEFKAEADGSFDRTVSAVLHNSYLLVTVSGTIGSTSIPLPRPSDLYSASAFTLNTLTDGFLPVFRVPFDDKRWVGRETLFSGNASNLGMAIDGAGNTHVFWTAVGTDGPSVWYRRRSVTEGWSNPQNVADYDSGNVVSDVKVVANDQGDMVAVWSVVAGLLPAVVAVRYYDRGNGYALGDPISMEANSARYPDVTIDPGGTAHLTYIREGNGGPGNNVSHVVYRYSIQDPQEWGDTSVMGEATLPEVVIFPRIGNYGEGNLVLIWQGTDALFARRQHNGSSWSSPVMTNSALMLLDQIYLGVAPNGTGLVVRKHHSELASGAPIVMETYSATTGTFEPAVTLGRSWNLPAFAMTGNTAVVAWDGVDVQGGVPIVTLRADRWVNGTLLAATDIAGGFAGFESKVGGAVVDKDGNMLCAYLSRDTQATPYFSSVASYSQYAQTWSSSVLSSTPLVSLGIAPLLAISPQGMYPYVHVSALRLETGVLLFNRFE